MNAPATPQWAQWIVSALLVISGLLALTAGWGLARLRHFFLRMHLRLWWQQAHRGALHWQPSSIFQQRTAAWRPATGSASSCSPLRCRLPASFWRAPPFSEDVNKTIRPCPHRCYQTATTSTTAEGRTTSAWHTRVRGTTGRPKRNAAGRFQRAWCRPLQSDAVQRMMPVQAAGNAPVGPQ